MKRVLVGLLVILTSILLIYKFDTNAESLPTSLTVGNSPPTFTAGPVENPSGQLINEGSDIAFEATADEPNGESYYLAICTTDSITPGVSGVAPTCGGSAFCVSNATSSDSQASCSYTVHSDTNETNTWYAFVCDNNTNSSECSTSSQGSGPSGSPFSANHYPEFVNLNASASANPGGSITFWSTIAYDTNGDDIRLVVCGDTSGATRDGCTGTQLCVSTDVQNNPSCQYNIPSVADSGTFNYYAYLFDSHGLGASENSRDGTYSINNVAPVVSSVTINGGSNIDLTESSTTDIVVTGTVTDNNSCQDLVTVEASIYRSSVAYSGCDTDAEDDTDSCYAQVSCTVTGGTCTGSSDASADYTCTIPVEYNADPTVASTQYPSDTWLSTVNAIDSSLSDNTEVAAGVEMNTLNAVDVGSNLNYGNFDVGGRDSYLDVQLIVQGTGNVGVDFELSGTNMTDGGSGVINVSKQKYALYCDMQSYVSDGIALTSSAVEEEFNLRKKTHSYTPIDNFYWGIEIPTEIPPGTYTGTNTITSVLGEAADWDTNHQPCGPASP